VRQLNAEVMTEKPPKTKGHMV